MKEKIKYDFINNLAPLYIVRITAFLLTFVSQGSLTKYLITLLLFDDSFCPFYPLPKLWIPSAINCKLMVVLLKKQNCSATQLRSWHSQTASPILISHRRQNMVDGAEFLNPLSASKTRNGLDHLVTWPNIWNLSSSYLSFSDFCLYLIIWKVGYSQLIQCHYIILWHQCDILSSQR